MTSKGSKELPAGKRLHFLVAIAFNRGVVHKTILNIPITYVNNLLLSMPKCIDI